MNGDKEERSLEGRREGKERRGRRKVDEGDASEGVKMKNGRNKSKEA